MYRQQKRTDLRRLRATSGSGGNPCLGNSGETIRVWEFQADEPWASMKLEAQVHSVALNGRYVVAGTTAGITVLGMTWKPE